jgi:N-methylhydantoinase B/oxoprolinase/acetone carboxylase alpha subunit
VVVADKIKSGRPRKNITVHLMDVEDSVPLFDDDACFLYGDKVVYMDKM